MKKAEKSLLKAWGYATLILVAVIVLFA